MEETRQQEQAALIALLRASPASWAGATADVLEAGSALDVWRAWWTEHEPVTLLEPADDAANADPLAAAAADIDSWAQQGWILTTVLDEAYPPRLREIPQAPPFLFSRGQLLPDDPAVAVVGSREASGRGLGIARGIAHELVKRRISVAAGLARGIDTAAHRTTLDEGGRAVAVIGTGISRVYPPENAGLHEEIARRGLLLSQFWPEAPPQKHTFLMRNATMSGYSLATVVVEAGEKSGARVQARLAVQHGRPVILTDLVVERNEWARALTEQPGVQVASGLRESARLIDGLIAGQQEVRAELDRPATAAQSGAAE